MTVTAVDHDVRSGVSMAVVRTLAMALAALLAVASGCGSKSKKADTTPGSTGTVTTEDTELMDDGAPVPDGGSAQASPEPSDPGGAAGGEAGGEAGDEASGDDAPQQPEIVPPDLDVSAAAQQRRVAQYLDSARSALRGPEPDPDAAIREARAALAVDASNIDAVVLIAHANYAKRLYDTAEVMLDMMFKSRKKAKSNPRVYYVYGLIYDKTDRPEQAMVAYSKAVELDPNYSSALINLGVHYLRNRKYGDAIALYEKLTGELGVKNAVTWTNLGSAYRGRSGDYPTDSPRRDELLREAELAYKRALSADRNYANAYYNLGLLYLDAVPFPGPGGEDMDKLKRLERAKTYFDEYRAMSDADIDLVADRLKQVKKLIKREKKRRERKQSGDDDW